MRKSLMTRRAFWLTTGLVCVSAGIAQAETCQGRFCKLPEQQGAQAF